MNKHVILLSAAAVLLFSCSREAEPVILPGETITFTAGWARSDETRTILQTDGTSVWWDASEQINVFFSDKASGKFTSTNSQPQAVVDFQGSLPIVVGSVETENPPHAYWAVYPYNAANTCDGESVTLSVPATQTAKEGSFADKMFPSIATSTNFYLAFYNVCGGVRFTVANEGIASITIKANNGESLTGKVKVGFDGVPVVESVVEGNSEVVVNAPTGGFVPGKYYFAALLPQTLTKGVSLTFKKVDGKVATTSLENSITINRSRFGKMEEKDKGLEFKDDGSGHNPSDNIVFADSKVKERLVAKFDTNGDGELSFAEAAAVSSIEGVFTIKTITSFDEFQYFTGVKSIPDECFKDWTKLTSITLPPSITSIGNFAFYNCPKLASMIIPQNVEYLGECAFENCSDLISVSILGPITEICQGTFYQSTSLTTVSLPETVTRVGSGAFSGCSNLISVNIPNGVKSIGEQAFYFCSSLKTLDLPNSITSIEGNAFWGCSSLTSIIVPENVTIIDGLFGECSSLTSVVLPKKLTTIYGGSFRGCSSLSSITIPSSVTFIELWAFSDCPSLVSIDIDPSNVIYDSRDNCNAIIETASNSLISGCRNTIIPDGITVIKEAAFWGCSTLVSIHIPNSVTIIEKSAFFNCSNLSSINIPESVINIEQQAFRNCASLTSIVIPESITKIEEGLFFGCSSLSSVIIPESVTSIGNNAFRDCKSLPSIVIPDSITSIGMRTFQDCPGLVSVTVKPDTPPGGSKMFENSNSVLVYVPSGSVEKYKAAYGWKDYADRIQAIQD